MHVNDGVILWTRVDDKCCCVLSIYKLRPCKNRHLTRFKFFANLPSKGLVSE